MRPFAPGYTQSIVPNASSIHSSRQRSGTRKRWRKSHACVPYR